MAPVIPINACTEADYVVLELALPSQPIHNIGVLLVDGRSGKSRFRLRDHWQDLAGADDIPYLAALQSDFENKIAEMGALRFLASLEDSLSHILRVSDRVSVPVDSFSRVVDRLFEEYVEPLPVGRYQTHLPLFSLRAAAGKFGVDEEVEEEDWIRAPSGLRLSEGMFVAHVVGHSMEPRIPHNSLNIFRAPVVGSRQGKIVLVELLGVHERFTVKRYTSRKSFSADDQWQHDRIRLEPLNPEYEAFDLAPEQIKYVIAEWICTLE